MSETAETATRDIDVIHEFTDFDTFTKAVEGAVLLKLDFDIATEIRKDELVHTLKPYKVTEPTLVRYWLITVHRGLNG